MMPMKFKEMARKKTMPIIYLLLDSKVLALESTTLIVLTLNSSSLGERDYVTTKPEDGRSM